MRAVVTGATGFVGRRLLARIAEPVVLSRDVASAKRKLRDFPHVTVYTWDPLTQVPPPEAFEGADAVFHLAGESVASYWSAATKQAIRESRVLGTRNLVAALGKLASPPPVLVSASAVGIYGSRGDEILNDDAKPAANLKDDFLAEVCHEWEVESHAAEKLGIRVVNPRIGVVLGENGGALEQMLPPFRFGMGAPLGSGDQWFPWVHVDDLARLMIFAAAHESLRGPINATAPNPVTNRELTQILGRVLGRWTMPIPVPQFMLWLMKGEMSQIIFASQRAIPKALTKAGFEFEYYDLEPALREILTPAAATV